MNSTLMIEKVKGFLYLGDYNKDEEPGFGIIKVFPYICPGDYEKTKERAILESHHLKNYHYNIFVRSEREVDDISRILLIHGFHHQVTKKNSGNIIRQWFSLLDDNPLDYLVYDETSIWVEVEENSLEDFINLVKSLRGTHSYRNIYQGNDEIFYIV